MELHGRSIIGNQPTDTVSDDGSGFRAFDPAVGQSLDPLFCEATPADVERAFAFAESAFGTYGRKSPEEIAGFLERIAEKIVALGEELIERASAETGLPVKRLVGERSRTVSQLQMFADIVKEGSWVEATIDRAQLEREPLPKPDVRRMLIPLGPIVVFGASNFPLAFSVAGGDTASAFAAGNPVIVKAHPAHPATSEMVARAIVSAAQETGMPDGIFSLLQGASHQLSIKVVQHPAAAAVGFTGSLNAGRAIFDAAMQRPTPIPVYAEMGSINPVFMLPGALREKADALAAGLQQSVTLGAGQFCTCPGLVVGLKDAAMDHFAEMVGALIEKSPPATMLHQGILRTYRESVQRLKQMNGLWARQALKTADEDKTEGEATLFATDAETFLKNEELSEEVFGPTTVIVSCASRDEIMKVARNLRGHLTATIHGTAEDLEEFRDLVNLLQKKVGRLVYNGFPTGVEVCAAMHHGGPYPATTDARATSVGAYAIKRFVRPVCFQNFPQDVLPAELQDKNHLAIWRTVNGQLTRADSFPE
ncbi:MAG TPA: aldehyde dehydrogenase (NADP(+)) [Pyrinomonadaceae bacterium]